MSYFWCWYQDAAAPLLEFDEIFGKLVPGSATRAALSLTATGTGAASKLVAYDQSKPIRDVAIHGPDGSWLALIGTPIVERSSRDDEQRFLREFFARPQAVLRDQVGGHFAAFGHDVAAGRFLAASDYNSTIPVFFTQTPTGVAFASHELALARATNLAPDIQGVAQFANLGVTWGSRTRFRDLRQMRPCQFLSVHEDFSPASTDYWSPDEEQLWSGDLDDHLRRWLPVLASSVRSFYDAADTESVMSDFTAGEDARLVVAACHGSGIPVAAWVAGAADDINVVVAKRAAEAAGFSLLHRRRRQITPEQVDKHVLEIVARSDGYRDLFLSCQQFATDAAEPLNDSLPRFAGIPGGEAFRGSYYLRGKALRPDARVPLDLTAFTRRKYLLDRIPGLMRVDDRLFLSEIEDLTKAALAQVGDFPLGTQIDHMLRMFQTSAWGLKYRVRVYLPLATGAMTRSVYQVRPRWKSWGRLTRASTEILWPELAAVRTQHGVPTVRKRFTNQHRFLAEYVATARSISRGLNKRVLKLSPPKKIGYSADMNAAVLDTLLKRPPFADWFASADSMMTGELYDGAALDSILERARRGTFTRLPTLGRILSHELALRWCRDADFRAH